MEEPQIKIGTLAGKGPRTAEYLRSLLPYGFESFQINFHKSLEDVNLAELGAELSELLAATGSTISCLGIYGNPLGEEPDDIAIRYAWESAIDQAGAFVYPARLRLHRPGPRGVHPRFDAPLRGCVRRAVEARRRPGRSHRLRKLPDGWGLA